MRNGTLRRTATTHLETDLFVTTIRKHATQYEIRLTNPFGEYCTVFIPIPEGVHFREQVPAHLTITILEE